MTDVYKRQVLLQLDDLLLGLGVKLVIDVAHQLLQQVLQGHQSAGPAILIHHHGHVDLFALHVTEEHVSPHRLRHEVGRAQQRPQLLGTFHMEVDVYKRQVPGG